MPFTENDDVVQALPPDRSDQSFAERILPRRAWSRDDFLDAHRLDAPGKVDAEDAVAVMNQESGCGFVGEGFDDLLGSPPGGGRGRDVEVQDASTIMGHDQQHVEHTERDRRDDEEVFDRSNAER